MFVPQPNDMSTVPPGSVLVLRYSRTLSSQEADDIKASMQEALPGIKLYILGGCQQALVYNAAPSKTDTDNG